MTNRWRGDSMTEVRGVIEERRTREVSATMRAQQIPSLVSSVPSAATSMSSRPSFSMFPASELRILPQSFLCGWQRQGKNVTPDPCRCKKGLLVLQIPSTCFERQYYDLTR